MRLRASMCAVKPDRIDGNTYIEMSGVRLLPGPQPERSRNAANAAGTQPERSRINGNTALLFTSICICV